MKARELPETPHEDALLRDEIAQIAAEQSDPDPRVHVVSSGLAAVKRRVVGLTSWIARARSFLAGAGQHAGAARER